MRKIILSVAVSLDGFIEGSNGEYDWCPPPSAKEMNAFLDRIDTIVMGRKSFESFSPKLFPRKKVVVFSTSLKNQKGATVVSSNLADQVGLMKKEPGKDIWLYGGASLTSSFINAGFVDEMWLGVVPVLLGSGKALFQNIAQKNHFTITEAFNNKSYLSVQLEKRSQNK